MSTDYQALLKQLKEAERPTPDMSKGLTVREWMEKDGTHYRSGSHSTWIRRLERGVALGLLEKDEDVRLRSNGHPYPVAVYREARPTKRGKKR